LFTEACEEIARAYDQLGHGIGWRFLASAQSTLAPSTPIALISMNPGGSFEPPDHGRESCERGSAYIVESWAGCPPGEAPLQRQIRLLFAELAEVQCADSSGDALLDASLSAYFVPFRSPSFDALAHQTRSLDFADRLWARLFRNLDPKLIITIDRQTTKRIARILKKKLHAPPFTRSFATGWGQVSADIVTFDGPEGARSILRFPHLSRYKLFGRSKSAQQIDQILQAVPGLSELR
jgi:hypothetical protein